MSQCFSTGHKVTFIVWLETTTKSGMEQNTSYTRRPSRSPGDTTWPSTSMEQTTLANLAWSKTPVTPDGPQSHQETPPGPALAGANHISKAGMKQGFYYHASLVADHCGANTFNTKHTSPLPTPRQSLTQNQQEMHPTKDKLAHT